MLKFPHGMGTGEPLDKVVKPCLRNGTEIPAFPRNFCATPLSPRGKLSHGANPGRVVPLFTRNHLWKERGSSLLFPTNAAPQKRPRCTQSSCSPQPRPASPPAHVPKSTIQGLGINPLFLAARIAGLWDSWHSWISEGASMPGCTGTRGRTRPRAQSCPFLGWRRRHVLHPPHTTQNKVLFLCPTLTYNYPK